MKTIFEKLALMLLGILIGLLSGEAILRILPGVDFRTLAEFTLPPWHTWRSTDWANPPKEVFRSHPRIGYEHSPNQSHRVRSAGHANDSFLYETNNLGLRLQA